ncbi:MAG: 4Fe-4S dicluster domain-containing protein [Syntrophomonadaceae bacterium]|jgi:ferredoxin|nr:4Fe-4S dicluster domain-containing protein [Syntrophomonadaceae bacterium]
MKLGKADIASVLDRLAEEAQVYVPLLQQGVGTFAPWSSERAADLALDALNTVLSPKAAVLPQTERMYSFRAVGDQAEVTEVAYDTTPRVVFGLRACDAKALACLDEVFLTRTYVDEFYRARRDNTTLVARSCPAPGPNCFCSSMGVDPMQPAGADVILHDLGEAWGWEPVTERGQQLTSRVRDLLQDGGFEKPQAGAFAIELDMQGVPEKLAALFEHPLWEELAARCMNCGICTYVCPSCYCFDIQVKNRGSEGYRFRCWDSCMYYEYSKMAGGHNPRERKADRFRNRFLHKLEFFHERYGSLLCTGCGRCMAMCPHGVNIVTLIERVREVEGHV